MGQVRPKAVNTRPPMALYPKARYKRMRCSHHTPTRTLRIVNPCQWLAHHIRELAQGPCGYSFMDIHVATHSLQWKCRRVIGSCCE